MFCCPAFKGVWCAGVILAVSASGWHWLFPCCQPESSIQVVNSQLVSPAHAASGKSMANECCSRMSSCDAVPQAACCSSPDGIKAANLTAEAPQFISTDTKAESWGAIKGQILFGGASVPTPATLNVTSDQGHCLAKGPLTDQTWMVDAASKGVANVVVFILPERGEKLPIHDSLKATPSEFILDQPHCVFTPHVFAIRAGQGIKAKNPDPVSHNVVIKGLRNDLNVQVAPGTEKILTVQPETNAVAVSCGSHPWMRGFGWCFDHPYFAVTDKDGKFEIKHVPPGARKLIIWHEKDGYLPGFSKKSGDQKILTITDGGVIDLGQIKVNPK